jgi:hypothetical protein
MSRGAAMDELEKLYRTAVSACDEGVSTADFERSFIGFLNYIECHPSLREQAEALLLDGLCSTPTPWELVSFCMHALRWERIKQKVEAQRTRAGDPRAQRALDLILDSFSDEWDQRDLYSYAWPRRGERPE